MGYLNNSSVTVDAILTNKGREKLSMGAGNFNISKFALSDDEVDYDLWNPAHPLGTNYYGIIIENMPLVEAVPDESQMMRYKLITLPKTAKYIPIVSANPTSINLVAYTDQVTVQASTSGPALSGVGLNTTLGYTAIVGDGSLISLTAATQVPNSAGSTPQFVGDADSKSISVIGMTFSVKVNSVPTLGDTYKTNITIIGNETGGSVTIPVTVNIPPTPAQATLTGNAANVGNAASAQFGNMAGGPGSFGPVASLGPQ